MVQVPRYSCYGKTHIIFRYVTTFNFYTFIFSRLLNIVQMAEIEPESLDF